MNQKGLRPGPIRRVAFCSASFGFGPVSKAVAVAEAIRVRRPEYRLVFIGSGLSEGYARSSGAFDDFIAADVDDQPELGVIHARQCDALVNAMNLGVMARWDADMPPHFFLDSLAWMWPTIPPELARARAYFVQDFPPKRPSSVAELPDNTVFVPPILSPSIQAPRDDREVQKGYLLVHLAGCRNPFLPPRFYNAYVTQMLAGLEAALRRIDREGSRTVNRVVACGNQELLEAAASVDWTGLSFPVERRFIARRDFLRELRRCETFLTTPGLTATLEALALEAPCRFLLPHNFSQFLIMRHYRSMGLDDILWPDILDSPKLRDPGLREREGVLEVGRLLKRQLKRDVGEIAEAFRTLILAEGEELSSLLRSGIQAWDGSSRVARFVIREIE